MPRDPLTVPAPMTRPHSRPRPDTASETAAKPATDTFWSRWRHWAASLGEFPLRAAGLALLLAGITLVGLEYLVQRNALLQDLRIQARIVGENGAPSLLFGDPAAARRILDSLAASPAIVEAALVTPVDTVLAEYRRPNAPPANSLAWPGDDHGFHARYMDLIQPIEFDGQHLGQIRVRASLDILYSRLFRFAVTTAFVSLAALGIALLLVFRMQRRVDRTERKLKMMAHTDAVTGLPNRAAFQRRLATAIVRAADHGHGTALLMLDLDNFKLVNDTLGHATGDALLTVVAKRLRDTVKPSGSVSRLGGDEFAIILETSGNAAEMAQRILDVLQPPVPMKGGEIYTSASIGISLYPEDAEDIHGLIRHADTALHAAKARGRNNYTFFDTDMKHRSRRRLSLESGLRRALEQGEFELYYQPQTRTGDDIIVGAEALLRWIRPDGKAVSPAEFVPVAEESGLIQPLGEWVLYTACAQAQAWRQAGLPPITMAVNVSGRQFEGGGLDRQVLEALQVTGLPPEALELEITETALMDNIQEQAGLLERLSQAGIKLAIDDFGTGYSSMTYLKRFPIDKLKIDRGFISDLTTDADDDAIVSAIVAMSHSLGIHTLAEGVETPAQRQRLGELGCDYIQGYAIGRPMSADALAERLAAQRQARAEPRAA